LPLFFLLRHRYSLRPAFFGTNAAALTVKEVGGKISVLILFNAPFGTEEVTTAALDAFLGIGTGPLRTPAASLILTGTTRLSDDTTCVQVFPG